MCSTIINDLFSPMKQLLEFKSDFLLLYFQSTLSPVNTRYSTWDTKEYWKTKNEMNVSNVLRKGSKNYTGYSDYDFDETDKIRTAMFSAISLILKKIIHFCL